MTSADAFEDHTCAIQITTLWNDGVRDVKLVGAKERGYFVGEDESVDWTVPVEHLPLASWPLVRRSEDGEFQLSFTENATGEMVRDGVVCSLQELRQQRGAAAAAHGGFVTRIVPGATYKVELGESVFLVRAVRKERAAAQRAPMSWRQQTHVALSVVLHLCALFLILSIPPQARALSLDDFNSGNRFTRFIVKPLLVDPVKALPEYLADRKSDTDGKGIEKGNAGRKHAGKEGKAGNPHAAASNGKLTIRGESEALALARRRADDAFRHYLGRYDSAASRITSVYGGETALGDGERDVLAGLIGDRFSDAAGDDGLGLYDDGPGGGGDGELIGIGDDDGPYTGTPFVDGKVPGWRKKPVDLGDHTEVEAEVATDGTPEYRGSLTAAIIRRVVRRHKAEVKHCYERELTKDPELYGKLEIFFVIDPTGLVVKARVDSSTMKNTNVEACVVEKVKRFRFPAPKGGGIVEVRYPFVFHTGGPR